jgi:hypothetical protein
MNIVSTGLDVGYGCNPVKYGNHKFFLLCHEFDVRGTGIYPRSNGSLKLKLDAERCRTFVFFTAVSAGSPWRSFCDRSTSQGTSSG